MAISLFALRASRGRYVFTASADLYFDLRNLYRQFYATLRGNAPQHIFLLVATGAKMNRAGKIVLKKCENNGVKTNRAEKQRAETNRAVSGPAHIRKMAISKPIRMILNAATCSQR